MSEELKSKFEDILNKQFEPNSETPLWACIALSSDKDAYFKAMQAAYDMPKSDKWVSVKTALPKESGEYLCFGGLFDYEPIRTVKVFDKDEGRFISSYKIQFWQPLPTPPNQ